ncbi:pilus assembly protein PilZ [Peribacillus saganii]|uniref:Pilus assembly protein PilZ n=1 Tax=Peribacillus saganii TaxID=2303992 RepID=A0A372LMI1_9BACI|nr:flagellar brake domain-containing protein [Peribacillus saganii]RFU68515.1 pilus assembly protein PilZ [Peribacillus saganii]
MIKIGNSIIIEPKFSLQPEKYKAMVVEIEDNQIYIDYPVNLETGKTVFLIDGTQLKITFIDPEHAVYIFDTEVLGRKIANIPMIHLHYPDKDGFVKIQRRQYVRVDTRVDTAVHPENAEFLPFTAVTADLSAGGAGLEIPKHIKLVATSHIYLWMVLPLRSGEIQYMRLKSKVIRISEQKGKYNKASIQFVETSEGDRQNLIRFVFERQLEKKKGVNI